jgi:hypothetical protein
MRHPTKLHRALVATANRMLAAERTTAEARNALSVLAESTLMEVGAYKGFRYLTASELPHGVEPGIIYGSREKGGFVENVYPDQTRRAYLI